MTGMQFFICPNEVEFKYNDLKVPMDDSVAKLDDVFRSVRNAHKQKIVYEFDASAQSIFIEFHDDLSERKLAIVDDENRRGILSKAKGQLARIAMVIHSIESALESVSYEDSQWRSQISVDSLETAKVIMDYIIDQKFALMLPEVKVHSTSSAVNISSGIPIIDNNSKYFQKFMMYQGKDIVASDVSRFRLMPPTPTEGRNKYPVDQCRSFMRSISDAGFGNIDETPNKGAGSSKKKFTFRKKPFCELGSSQRDTLKRLCIREDDYSAVLTSTPSSASTSSDSYVSIR